MLRASVPTKTTHQVAILSALVDAVASRPPQAGAADAGAAREAVVDQLGLEWLVDACAVIGNFEMMTRIADGTGARLRAEQLDAAAPIIAALGLDGFPSVRR